MPRKGREEIVALLFILAYLAPSFALSQRETQAIPHCAERIYSENLTHTLPVIMSNKVLTSSVFYNGKGVSCILDSNTTLRIELPRMTRVSDVGIHLNGKIFVHLVKDVASNQSFQFDCPSMVNSTDDVSGFTYFSCRNSKGLYESRGVVASAVELAASYGNVLISLKPNETWMYIIQKRYNDHPYYGNQCLSPVRYSTQTLSQTKAVFKHGESVTYDCFVEQCPLRSCTGNRTCRPNGWSGRPPLCMNGKGHIHGIMSGSMSKNETIYRFNHTFIQISTVTVDFDCSIPPCEHEQMNRKPMVEIALRRVVPQIGVTWLKANNYTHGTRLQIVLTPSISPGKFVSCRDCAVKVTFRDYSWQKHWSVSLVVIEGWSRSEFETYLWMMDGCPPIDPYVGMPEEYANEASKNRDVLNENLRQNPCREGYWHNRTLQYEQNPRRCLENSWTGEIPQCVQITCKTPPRIENGSWRYRGNGFYEVVYSCDEPLVLSGDETVRCNYTSNEWQGVPSCTEIESTSLSSDATITPYWNDWIIAAVGLAGAVLVVAIIAIIFISLRKGKNTSYVEPIKWKDDVDEWDFDASSNTEESIRMAIRKNDAGPSTVARDSLKFQELEHYATITPESKTSLGELKVGDPVYELPNN